jgi:hypothetical protein
MIRSANFYIFGSWSVVHCNMISLSLRTTRRIYNLLLNILSPVTLKRPNITTPLPLFSSYISTSNLKPRFRIRRSTTDTCTHLKPQPLVQEVPRRKRRATFLRIAQTLVVVVVVLGVSMGVYAWHYRNMKKERRRKKAGNTVEKTTILEMS